MRQRPSPPPGCFTPALFRLWPEARRYLKRTSLYSLYVIPHCRLSSVENARGERGAPRCCRGIVVHDLPGFCAPSYGPSGDGPVGRSTPLGIGLPMGRSTATSGTNVQGQLYFSYNGVAVIFNNARRPVRRLLSPSPQQRGLLRERGRKLDRRLRARECPTTNHPRSAPGSTPWSSGVFAALSAVLKWAV